MIRFCVVFCLFNYTFVAALNVWALDDLINGVWFPCKRNDREIDDCIIEVATAIQPYMKNFTLPGTNDTLDPGYFVLQENSENPSGVKNLSFEGLQNYEVSAARFQPPESFKLEVFFPYLIVNYTFRFDNVGMDAVNGLALVRLKETTCTIKVNAEVTRDNHLSITAIDFKFDPKAIAITAVDVDLPISDPSVNVAAQKYNYMYENHDPLIEAIIKSLTDVQNEWAGIILKYVNVALRLRTYDQLFPF